MKITVPKEQQKISILKGKRSPLCMSRENVENEQVFLSF